MNSIMMKITLAGGIIVFCAWLCGRHVHKTHGTTSTSGCRCNGSGQSPGHSPGRKHTGTDTTRSVEAHSASDETSRRYVRLQQVHPNSETDTDIDIIAIHGLDTNSPNTWTWKDRMNYNNRVDWLKDPDMLPSRVRSARIFTCDWPADLLQPSDLVQSTMDELALRLLDSIQRRPLLMSRSTRYRENGRRPIFFIASCLGGIILIKALVKAAQEQQAYRSVWEATHGVLFLTTPFRGTSFQDVALWVEPGLRVWASMKGREVNHLLDSVKRTSSELPSLVRKFTELCRSRDSCHVLGFYEKGKTSLPGRVFPWLPACFRQEKQLVDESSAILDIVDNPLSLDRSHVMMNKFCGPECPDYNSVVGKITKTLESIRKGSWLAQADNWICNNHYTGDRLKVIRLSGETLPMNQCYINLAIVEKPNCDEGEPGTRHQNYNDPFLYYPTSLRKRLKIETPDKNKQVDLPNLFNPRQGSDGQMTVPRRILIRGRAGVGKTTLCKKIVSDFYAGKLVLWNALFDRVLWVPLRVLKDQLCSFEDLFYHHYFDGSRTDKDHGRRLSRELSQALDSEGARTLFLLDGLDEVPDLGDIQENRYCFFLELLKQSNVIITSRPHARLPASYGKPDFELETIGFYLAQVQEYLDKVMKDILKVEKIRSLLDKHYLLQSLVRIPIQLDALCLAWDEGFKGKATPETMTTIYKTMALSLWKKDVVRLGIKKARFVEEADQLEIMKSAKVAMVPLECLAFSGLCSNVIEFQPKHREEVVKFLESLGGDHSHRWDDSTQQGSSFRQMLGGLSFLRTSDHFTDRSYSNHHFLHLTFQEFFAAQYFERQWTAGKGLRYIDFDNAKDKYCEVDPVAFLQLHKYDARYDIFWRFVAGLLQANGSQEQLYNFFEAIEDRPRDLLGPVHQRLVMHCLSEVTQSEEIPQLTGLHDNLRQWLLFECSFLPNQLHSSLAIEVEFPSQILEAVLHEVDHNIVQSKVLASLDRRPQCPPAVKSYMSCLPEQDRPYTMVPVSRVRGEFPWETIRMYFSKAYDLLRDPDENVRSMAADHLGQCRVVPGEMLADLAKLMADPSIKVRYRAAAALGKLGEEMELPGEIIQALAELLRDPDERVQSQAARALAQQSVELPIKKDI